MAPPTYELTQTLSVLDMESGTVAESSCTLSALRVGQPLVLDLWHTKCVRCPAALTKLNAIAASGKHPGVVFAACALSLCDKPDGPSSEDEGREQVTELVDDMWDSLKHCYMTADEKAAAKAELGFAAVPFCIVFGADGGVRFKGDPSKIDFATVFDAPAASEDTVTKAVAKIALTSPKPALTPLGEANRDEAAAPPAAQQPVLGFGNDEEDF